MYCNPAQTQGALAQVCGCSVGRCLGSHMNVVWGARPSPQALGHNTRGALLGGPLLHNTVHCSAAAPLPSPSPVKVKSMHRPSEGAWMGQLPLGTHVP